MDDAPIRRRDWLLLVAYTATILLWNLGSARLFTSHECYVALGAREMGASGDWLIPRVDGEEWLEKPPLAHWVIAAFASVTGEVNEFTARLPSAMCGLLGVVLLTRFVARVAGRTVALLTGLVQATSMYFVTYARLCEADIYLWALIVACLVTFASCWVEPHARPDRLARKLAFFALLGATGLAKGPLFGAVLVLLPCGAFLLSQRSWAACRWLLSPLGWLTFAAVAAAWPAAVALQHPDALALWRYHTIDRIGSDKCFNPEPVWYYLTSVPWQVLPWTFVLLPALPRSLRTAWREPRSLDRFLWLWFAVPFVALSAMKAKHHHYLIHALPPCAVWSARGLVTWRDWIAAFNASRRRVALSAAFGVALVAVATWKANVIDMPRVEMFVGGASILLATGVIGWACVRRRDRLAAGTTFAALGALLIYANAVWLPRTDRYPSSRQFLRTVNAHNRDNRTVVLFGLDPARPILYLRSPHVNCKNVEQLRAALARHPDAYVLAADWTTDAVCATFGYECVERMTTNMPTRYRPPIMALCRAKPRGE